MHLICEFKIMTIQKRLTVIGLKIKTKRLENQIKPKDLAKKLEISVNTLYTIESGTNPNPTFKVLAALQDELCIQNLFDYEQPATNEPIGNNTSVDQGSN